MVVKARVQLDGIAELKAALEALGTDVATKTGVVANRKAAQQFRDHLRQTAPASAKATAQNQQYGTLRENIRAGRRKARKQGNIVHSVTIGKAFWGFFQEFGTAKMPARPWMRPAFEAMAPQLLQTQITNLREGIDKAARRLARKRK